MERAHWNRGESAQQKGILGDGLAVEIDSIIPAIIIPLNLNTYHSNFYIHLIYTLSMDQVETMAATTHSIFDFQILWSQSSSGHHFHRDSRTGYFDRISKNKRVLLWDRIHCSLSRMTLCISFDNRCDWLLWPIFPGKLWHWISEYLLPLCIRLLRSPESKHIGSSDSSIVMDSLCNPMCSCWPTIFLKVLLLLLGIWTTLEREDQMDHWWICFWDMGWQPTWIMHCSIEGCNH